MLPILHTSADKCRIALHLFTTYKQFLAQRHTHFVKIIPKYVFDAIINGISIFFPSFVAGS